MASSSTSTKNNETQNTLALVRNVWIEAVPVLPFLPSLNSSYNDRIRPLLDAVDKLRDLNVMQEGIQIPTIVVVGDQSSGKSSVLESLAGISLPRGQGICTRVPLIMRLQHHQNPQPELRLEYNGKTVQTNETKIADDINVATDIIAGDAKGISDSELTLVVKKNGVPDLTMIDLPGITRNPVRGQPEDIYEQISKIIMKFIEPQESIILNVLSATDDFPTCESIRMSRMVDKTGVRTLAVVTKCDVMPEGLLEKVTNDDVKIGLGYVCVRNGIGDESYEDARMEEADLFETHPLLSKIDKSMVGIPVLAARLVQIQATSISKCLPDIIKKINQRLSDCMSLHKKMPEKMTSVAESMAVFTRIIGYSKESVWKLVVRGEFDEYPDDKTMHCTARLAEILNGFLKEMRKSDEINFTSDFLVEEIKVLEEARGIWLPNFLSHAAFMTLLHRKVQSISRHPVKFVEDIWDCIENVVVAVLKKHFEHYLMIQVFTKRAATNLVQKAKEKVKERVMEIVEMEYNSDYTCDTEYMSVWSRLVDNKNAFEKAVNNNTGTFSMEGFGVDIHHLRKANYDGIRDQAFDLKMRITAYWKIVVKRIVDSVNMYLLLSLKRLVKREMEGEIVSELVNARGGNMEWIMEESPSVAKEREELNKRIVLLKESKEVLSKIIDKIVLDFD